MHFFVEQRGDTKITIIAAKTHVGESMGELVFNKLNWCYHPAPGAWKARPVHALLSAY